MEAITSRQRVATVLSGGVPDRVPVDLGGTFMCTMHVSTVYRVRQALGLDPPGTPVKVVHPSGVLGEVGLDLLEAIGGDVVGLHSNNTRFGFPNEGWKPWTYFDGTPCLVPAGFNTEPDPSTGDYYMYPQNDRTAKPSAVLQKGGFYFNAISRQQPIDDAKLDPRDNLEEFPPMSEADIEWFRVEAERLYTTTDKAIILNFGGGGLGDVALVTGVGLREPKGIRDVEEWYVSTAGRKDYVRRVFELQTEVALHNLDRLHQAVGDKACAIMMSGTDFGTQRGPLVSPRAFNELYKPFYRRMNDWVHNNTRWKVFMHCCGGIRPLIPHIIEAGFDILNPVQITAAGMEPAALKRDFGDKLVFWGGGVDTQRTLPFGTPDEVRENVTTNLKALGAGGGFVFTTVHNVQCNTPPENVLAMYDTVKSVGRYPL